MKKSRIYFAFLTIFAIITTISTPATAAPGDSISLYFSAPFVTGTHVSNAVTETFNGYSDGATVGTNVPCPTSIPGFATVTYSAGGCTIGINADSNSGSSEPAIGLANSSFVSKTLDTTFTFPNPVKYVGFWWMMGSTGNSVQFLDSSGGVVATLNVNDVVAFLGSNSLVTNADTRTVATVEGGTHLKKRFYRSPGSYTGTVSNPVLDYDTVTYANEPWVYLNLFVSGSVSVSKVRFYGSNFEMDNLSVSTQEAGPRGDMVLMSTILGTAPVAQVISWSPTNTSINSGASLVTPDVPATLISPVSGGGAITYRVVDAGQSGCTVNSTTGAIRYTSIGTCIVRATAAAISGTYYTTYKDASFEFLSAPETSQENENELATTGSNPPVALSALGVLMIAAGFFVRFRKRVIKL
jgi:LPXTG-motif cell wall-anchored protein